MSWRGSKSCKTSNWKTVFVENFKTYKINARNFVVSRYCTWNPYMSSGVSIHIIMQQITNTSPVTVGKITTLKIFKISSNSVCVESAASKNCAFFCCFKKLYWIFILRAVVTGEGKATIATLCNPVADFFKHCSVRFSTQSAQLN